MKPHTVALFAVIVSGNQAAAGVCEEVVALTETGLDRVTVEAAVRELAPSATLDDVACVEASGAPAPVVGILRELAVVPPAAPPAPPGPAQAAEDPAPTAGPLAAALPQPQPADGMTAADLLRVLESTPDSGIAAGLGVGLGFGVGHFYGHCPAGGVAFLVLDAASVILLAVGFSEAAPGAIKAGGIIGAGSRAIGPATAAGCARRSRHDWVADRTR